MQEWIFLLQKWRVVSVTVTLLFRDSRKFSLRGLKRRRVYMYKKILDTGLCKNVHEKCYEILIIFISQISVLNVRNKWTSPIETIYLE